MRKPGQKKRGKRSVYNISNERFTTTKKAEEHQEIEECKGHKRKRLQGYFISVLS